MGTKAEEVRTPRLEDVAKQAGVSATTVSRVLNNTAPVSTRTRARVENAIQMLGYTPRNLASPAHIQGIGVLVTDILNPFYARSIRGVEEEVEQDGLALLLFDTQEDPARESRTLAKWVNWDLAGAIIFGSRAPAEELIAFQRKRKVPLVVMNRNVYCSEIACIRVDSEQATYRATQYLLNLGHEKIAFIAGPPLSDSNRSRQAGIARALHEAGLSLPSRWYVGGFPNSEGGFQAMSSLLTASGTERPTAALVYNDLMAMGALHAIRNHGLRVPEDLSVIGFDDISMAAHANPPLTTISQPKYRMGRLAVQLLRAIRRGDSTPNEGYVLLESPLVIRESTARPGR